MHISDFDYRLPPEAIAQEPLSERDESRLLFLPRAQSSSQDHRFIDLPDLLSRGDVVVVNRSRVLPARLHCRRTTGGEVELLLLRNVTATTWTAWARPGGRLKQGETIAAGKLRIRIDSEPLEPDGRRRVTALCEPADFPIHLETLGHVPLPPYIKRPDTPLDRDRYQTIFAREAGSVAAPTAGLHFTEGVRARLAARGIELVEMVLHVGPGTFQPVRVENVDEHSVEAEPYEIPAAAADAIARARQRGGRVVAVGTTVVRALESANRVGQAQEDASLIQPGTGETSLVIVPGFEFRVVDALVTNFHLPRSSLLLLVAAFAGRERVLEAYAEALDKGYRFYSYGDAMLIL